MDLGAYLNIPDLGEVAGANGIKVPRLRGYRDMSGEERVTEDDIQGVVEGLRIWLYEQTCRSIPRFYPESTMSNYSPKTLRIEKKYLIRKDGEVVGFRWDLLHGKARKRLKLAIKHAEKRVRAQMDTFNKYVGREGILYIHARIGGPNWVYYGGKDIEKQPWFIEKVDDHFDYTYCDIYARVEKVR